MHYIIRKSSSPANHRLLLYDRVTSRNEERLCCDRSVNSQLVRVGIAFQPVAYRSRNALTLMILVNIQAVGITALGKVTETDDNAVFLGNDRVMLRKRLVPSRRVDVSVVRPCADLFNCAVPYVYFVYGVIKQLRNFFAVGGTIATQQHYLSSRK